MALPTEHLRKSRGQLLSEALNFLDDEADASHSGMSEGALWSGILAAVGGSGSHLTMSRAELMAATWNALEPGAGASHLTMSEAALLAGIVNAFDADADASHLTWSVGQLYAGLWEGAAEGVTRINLSNLSIPEDASIGDLVGTMSVSGGSGTYTFSLTDDAGGLFAIDGADLEVAGALDYETATSHGITVEADNGVDTPISRGFTINVTDVVEGPADEDDDWAAWSVVA
jgi:hypothetical protein